MAVSADLILQGDVINRTLRQYQDWSLLPEVGHVGVVYPSFITNGFRNYPDFPQWLGKNSSSNKSKRVVKDIHEAMWEPSCGLTPDKMIHSGYSDLAYKRILMLLKAKKVQEAAKQMDALGVTKDLLMNQLTDTRSAFDLRDEFKLLDSSVKKDLTKELQKPEYLKQERGAGAKKRPRAEKEKKVKADVDGQESDAAAESDESEEPESEGEQMAAIIASAKAAAKASAKAKAKAKGKAKGRAKKAAKLG